MDLPSFANGLLSRAETLLPEWFPAGKWVGREYVVGNIQGDAGQSLSINSVTGVWADFGDPEVKGGDLLALYAAKRGLRMGEAAKELGWVNGAMTAPAPAKPTERACEPIPDSPPPLPGPTPSALYRYGSAFWIARYEGEGGKSFKPWTWRGGKWAAKGYPAPRPLYGLELLENNNRAVLLVEGEKCADAARTVLGRAYNVLTWAGGANGVAGTDWKPLYGLQVDLWPDADEPGNKAVAAILERLAPHIIKRVRVLEQTGQPEGWDIADAVAAGWGLAEMAAHVNREGGKHIKVIEAVELKKGRHHDGVAPVAVVEQPGEEGDKARSVRAWVEDLGLKVNTGGIPHISEANVLRILEGHDAFRGKIWLDEFAQLLMWETRTFERVDAIRAQIFIQENLEMHKVALTSVERAALLVADNHKRHPVKEWLGKLIWDGTDRLSTFMHDAYGADQTDYTAAVGRNWMVGMVARIYEPGCQCDYMPVFEGSQGIRKSSSLRALAGQWFKESHANPIKDQKEFLQGIQGHFLIELPEMHQIAGHGAAGIAQIKGLITNRVDHYREPYGVKVRPYPRQCIFAGTTNEDQWNPDPTGGRRFWPIACGQISTAYIEANREQLFAEAIALYRATHQWWQIPYEMAREEQDARRERDAWEDKILAYMHAHESLHNGISVADILEHCIEKDTGHWTQSDQNRVARALRANGYRKVRLNTGARPWVYRLAREVSREEAIKGAQLDAAEDF